MTNLTITNEDCMELMRRTPDGYYDLAVVDVPYGIKMHKEMGLNDKRGGGRLYRTKSKWVGGEWDNARPDATYFTELRRVSKQQIIWGGNYFADLLPPSSCWIVWDKVQRIDQADAELAWTSFKGSVRIFDFASMKLMGFQNPTRFHPTEKPVALYRWLLTNYAKPGQRILDTHMGSGSIAIAAYDLGFDLTACELDPDYYAAAMKRITTHIQTHPFGEDLQPKAANLNGMETLTLFA